MGDRLELAFRRAAAGLLRPDATVLVAVSGGADSVALLQLLVRWRATRPQPLHVAHLDHGLRPGSRADRRFVERLARELGLPCRSDRREVGALRRRGESPEEAARRVRRSFLLEAASEVGAEHVATGHTLDDQAETILMRLARGAGALALTGMAARGPGPFVRPLLGIERRDLRSWIERHGIRFREDPTNRDLRFDRNRVRQLVVPLLVDAINPRAARHLVKAAASLRDDAELLDALAARRLAGLVRGSRGARLALDAGQLAAEPAPIARRIARAALRRVGADGRRVSARHVAGLLDLAAGSRGRRLDLPGGLRARRTPRLLVLETRGEC